VLRAEFSPDGTRVLTASADGTARLWDLSGRRIATFAGHADAIEDAAFSPDGRWIVTASGDGTARQYLVELDDLLVVAAAA
jgi:WD40 repeat protein